MRADSSADYHEYIFGNVAKIHGFLAGCVAAADNGDAFVAVEEAVAGRAG